MNTHIPQRMPEKMVHDRVALDRLFADTAIAHVSLVHEGEPRIFATLVARVGDSLVIHGSTGSRWMRQLIGVRCAVALTAVEGIVVARSAFESSMMYRSAVIFGEFTPVPETVKDAVLVQLTDRLLPGRSTEVRAATRKELAATLLLQMPLSEWSLRISDDFAEDPDSDLAGDAWAGKIRFASAPAVLEPNPDLREGIVPPASVHCAAQQTHRFR